MPGTDITWLPGAAERVGWMKPLLPTKGGSLPSALTISAFQLFAGVHALAPSPISHLPSPIYNHVAAGSSQAGRLRKPPASNQGRQLALSSHHFSVSVLQLRSGAAESMHFKVNPALFLRALVVRPSFPHVRFGRLVATLVVLADQQLGWEPAAYHEELWGCRLTFEYPTCKLLELGRDPRRLERNNSPAAMVIAAHLAAQATSGDMELRKKTKWQLTRRLYERGYEKEDILELFRLIDWLLVLPENQAVAFRCELIDYEKEKAMPYITSIERLGRQEGR